LLFGPGKLQSVVKLYLIANRHDIGAQELVTISTKDDCKSR
jgi:hypothetical protein